MATLRRPRLTLLSAMVLVALAAIFFSWVSYERRKRQVLVEAQLERARRALALADRQITARRNRNASMQTWPFEADTPGETARGFSPKVGVWKVVVDGGNHVLAQEAKNDDDTFNVVLVEGANAIDLDLSVRLKAVAGTNDRGGGVVWRAKDDKNYYIARYNPLEDNFRVYKVENGKRTMFQDAKVPGDEKWHTLRITMIGPRITCDLDGKKYLEVEDSTFTEAGKIGLWSKSDAQTYFDDLTVSEIRR